MYEIFNISWVTAFKFYCNLLNEHLQFFYMLKKYVQAIWEFALF